MSNRNIFHLPNPQPPREVAGAAALPKEIAGQPVKYLWKEILRAGNYAHPFDRSLTFNITSQRMDKWVDNFGQLAAQGYRPYVPTKHSDIGARDNLGYVVELKREGDSLWGLHQLIGADAHLAAARNESSVYVDAYRDKSGRQYEEALIHNALVPDPVATGLGGFVPIALSASGDAGRAEKVPVLSLAASQESPMDLSKLALALGVATLASLDDAATQVSALVNAKKELEQKLQLSATAKADLETKLQAAETAKGAAEQKAMQLSAGACKPELLGDHAKLAEEKLGLRVERGLITPAQRDELLKLVKPGGKPAGLMFSRSAEAEPTPLDTVLAVIDMNKPQVEMGEKSGVQMGAGGGKPLDDPSKGGGGAGENTLLKTAQQMYPERK